MKPGSLSRRWETCLVGLIGGYRMILPNFDRQEKTKKGAEAV
ncbi:hypothetical protein MGWOODY_Hyp2133 [hydrothermal vent metagenome]|uniref:Uncharacterized protein n=1 Tax=hydrothermal vent metagenome TaxID=652676 RepID=A0A161JQ82_9ZZZZ